MMQYLSMIITYLSRFVAQLSSIKCFGVIWQVYPTLDFAKALILMQVVFSQIFEKFLCLTVPANLAMVRDWEWTEKH